MFNIFELVFMILIWHL